MDNPLAPLSSAVGRIGAVATNALEVARFGGLDTGEEASPFDVVHGSRNYRLRRYFPDEASSGGAPVILVPPLMLSAEVYDVAPTASAVRLLAENGADPWVVDFGSPDKEPGGLERTLADHVLAVSDAVERVGAERGRDVHIGGYSQGGMFCYQTAAYRRSEGIVSLITFGSPVDVAGSLPFGLPVAAARGVAGVGGAILGGRPVPAWASRLGFRLLDPAKSLRARVDFVRQLHDREALLPRERQRRFLDNDGWVAYPGPAILDLLDQFVVHNRMLSGGFVIEGHAVTLADITCPVLCFVGEIDEIAPPNMVRALRRAAPAADAYEVSLRAGHFGLVVGTSAAKSTWPVVAEWLRWQDGDGEKPEAIGPLKEQGEEPDPVGGFNVGHQLELAAGVGFGAARSALKAANDSQHALRGVAGEAFEQLPRLARLERSRAHTRISLGLLLDEQARRSPEAVCFLFEDRAHSYLAVKNRIDSVVKGLISIGVRQGDLVGVLMNTRPSALAIVSALNRLGAVAVLLRSPETAAREAELGAVTRVITDPENADVLGDRLSVTSYVLGGGGRDRELAGDLIDMERIDPSEVTLPAWYEPNPGRAQDVAFVMFTGSGDRIRQTKITNRRWALSAFGTATAASLSESDTVYAVAAVSHPAGLLTSIGGAIAGGSRLALATSFDTATFWDEVRRYGVTTVAYTWTQLHDLLGAPRNPAERHHPVRLFIGSGMPTGLWRRTVERFAPANVLEFYASTEGEAVLANLSGRKIGCKGRPLPGSAEVRIAAYDQEADSLIAGPDGLAIQCRTDEVGMLLASVDTDTGVQPARTLRGVFKRGDAWLATGDLFRRDADGDHWHIDHVPALIRTARGPVPTVPIEDALGRVDAVDLAVAYGVRGADDANERAVAAVTIRSGRKLAASELESAFASLEPRERPEFVRVVAEIPVTPWYRPIKDQLRAEGIPEGGGAKLFRADSTGAWKPVRKVKAPPAATPTAAPAAAG